MAIGILLCVCKLLLHVQKINLLVFLVVFVKTTKVQGDLKLI